jgi:hypothetical protein
MEIHNKASHANCAGHTASIYKNVKIENIKFIFILYEICIIDIVIYLYYKYAICQ